MNRILALEFLRERHFLPMSAKTEFQSQIGSWFIVYAADKEITLNHEEVLFYDAEGDDLNEMPPPPRTLKYMVMKFIARLTRIFQLPLSVLKRRIKNENCY